MSSRSIADSLDSESAIEREGPKIRPRLAARRHHYTISATVE
jgi:hypothetical protein